MLETEVPSPLKARRGGCGWQFARYYRLEGSDWDSDMVNLFNRQRLLLFKNLASSRIYSLSFLLRTDMDCILL